MGNKTGRPGGKMESLEQAVKEANIKYAALREEPDNLYKQFQYYCALKEVDSYRSVEYVARII